VSGVSDLDDPKQLINRFVNLDRCSRGPCGAMIFIFLRADGRYLIDPIQGGISRQPMDCRIYRGEGVPFSMKNSFLHLGQVRRAARIFSMGEKTIIFVPQ
jgi:hypothetical protein